MPYSGPGDPDLPSNVKGLPENRRAQWVHVWNSSFRRCEAQGGTNCEGVAFRNANGVIRRGAEENFADVCARNIGAYMFYHAQQEFAEPPEQINVLPRPGRYTHPLYGNIVVTRGTNAEFVTNFANRVYQQDIPIDISHEGKLMGAVGYYRELEQRDDGSVDARVEWTERGQQILREDRFRYFSPEWHDKWQDSSGKVHRHVLVGGALTNRPFFKEDALRPLVASDGEWWFEEPLESAFNEEFEDLNKKEERWVIIQDKQGKEGGENVDQITKEELDALKAQAAEAEQLKKDKAEAVAKVEEAVKAQEAAEAALAEAKKGDEGDDATKKLTEQLQASEEARKKGEERIEALEATDRRRRFKEVVLGRDDAGVKQFAEDKKTLHPMVGDLEAKVQIMEVLADTKGVDSDEFKAYVTSERTHASQLHDTGLYKEQGKTTPDEPVEADQKVEAAVKEWMEKHPDESEADAYTAVLEDNPQLYDEASKEHFERSRKGSK